MDLRTLTPPHGMTPLEARDWLRAMAAYAANETNWRMSLVVASAPRRLADAAAKAPEFIDWLLRSGLVTQETGRLRVTPDGLQVMAGNASPRTSKAKAWEQVEDFLVRARWLAQAPYGSAPVKPDGIYLFGSLLDEARPDHGDADLAVGWARGNAAAKALAQDWFDATGFTFLSDWSGRNHEEAARKGLARGSGFLAISGDPEDVFASLLRADAALPAIELAASLRPPTAAVSRALGNAAARPDLAAVRQRIAQIQARVAGLTDAELASRAVAPVIKAIRTRLEGSLDRVPPPVERAIWWASLGPQGPQAALAAAAQAGRLAAFEAVVDEVAYGMRKGATAREWSRQWRAARRAFAAGCEADLPPVPPTRRPPAAAPRQPARRRM